LLLDILQHCQIKWLVRSLSIVNSTWPYISNFVKGNLFQHINLFVLLLINKVNICSPVCIYNFLIWICETVGSKICRWRFQCIHWMKDCPHLRIAVKSCTLQCILNLENQKIQAFYRKRRMVFATPQNLKGRNNYWRSNKFDGKNLCFCKYRTPALSNKTFFGDIKI
jgi:integrase